MKINLKKTPEVVAMFKLMADTKNSVAAQEAREAFAAFIQAPIMRVIEAEAILGSLFASSTFDYGTPSTIPLAPLFDIRQNDFIRVWSQPVAGGLVTSQNMSVDELWVMTHNINSAVSFKLDYVRAARVDVVAAYLQWASQEILRQQEADSAAVISTTAAQTQYIGAGNNAAYQVLRSTTQGTVTVQDFNRLATLMSRVNRANIGGTPAVNSRSITTLIGSPEFLEVLKNSAFQPQNTQAATTSIPSSDKFRDDIYNAVGNPSWYGTELMVVYDLGVNQAYNFLFANAAGSTTYQGYNNGTPVAFSPGSEQVVWGIDRRKNFLARLSETSPENSSTLSVSSDNQWSTRSKTIGFYMEVNEGRVSLDGRNVCSLVF